jgi:excisionase family DNA binding protein
MPRALAKQSKRRPRAAKVTQPAQPLVTEVLAVKRREAARMLGVAERTVTDLIARKELRVTRIGRNTLIHTSSLRALLDADVRLPGRVKIHTSGPTAPRATP